VPGKSPGVDPRRFIILEGMKPSHPKRRGIFGIKTGYWWIFAGLLWATAGFIGHPGINFPVALMHLAFGFSFLRRERGGLED
jgi:hypothetical protein